MKEIKTNKAPSAIGPYSQGIISGNMLYTSGQIPVDPATGNIPDGVEEQAHQVFKNIKNLLAEAGAEMSQVVKTCVFIQNMDDFSAINDIYSQYFTEPYPARSCVEVAKLPKGVLLEVEAVTELK
jgi:2-iminobutanoate/2-iminopropanoate deaminase